MKKLQQKMYLYMLCILLVSIGLLIFGIVYGINLKNWSFVYTILLTVPFLLFSKLILFTSDAFLSNKKNISHSRVVNFFKLAWIFIIKNVIFMIPFLVVCVTVFCTTNINGVQSINECEFFNVWMCFSLTVFASLIWMILNTSLGYSKNRAIKSNKTK